MISCFFPNVMVTKISVSGSCSMCLKILSQVQCMFVYCIILLQVMNAVLNTFYLWTDDCLLQVSDKDHQAQLF